MRLALALCACGAVALQPARTQQHRRCDPLASTASRPPRTGRGRAAKFIASREAEASYAARLRGLLRWEREAEERAAKQRLEEWSDARLLDEGVAQKLDETRVHVQSPGCRSVGACRSLSEPVGPLSD